MRKIGLSLVLAGILGATNAVAEESGAFAGIQLGYGGANGKWTATNALTGAGQDYSFKSNNMSSFRYGLLAGYKHFFTPAFGVRAYASFDLGTKYSKDTTETINNDSADASLKVNTYNINANVDALYNFITNDTLDFGVFAGLSLGYTHHKADFELAGDNGGEKWTTKFDGKLNGFDLGINFGLRANIATNHGIELYSRFGVLKHKGDIDELDVEEGSPKPLPLELQQPYQVGLRYTFSF